MTGGAPDVVRVTTGRMGATQTGLVSFSGNVPATPQTPSYSAATAGSDIWTWPAASPTPAGTPPPMVSAATVPDAAAFAANSISGPTVTMYDATGNPVDVAFRWAKTQETAAGSTWGLYVATTAGRRLRGAPGRTPRQ